MVDILERIKRGDGTPEDLKQLEELAETVKVTSLCGLGRTAPNPVLTTLRYFHDEYEAHVNERRCPALACTDLIYFEINDDCVGCGICVKECATNAITGERKKKHHIDQVKCMRCGTCVIVCPPKIAAVEKHSPAPVAAS
jgi:heterodisulfide reductase subunit A-like polyferredoxin